MLAFKLLSPLPSTAAAGDRWGRGSPQRFSLVYPCTAIASTRPLRADSAGELPKVELNCEDGGEEEKDGGGVGGIHVPREGYIRVPKAVLLDALLARFGPEDAIQFARFARCLDSILHAEHKELLEEMRTYYLLTCQEENFDESAAVENNSLNHREGFHWMALFERPPSASPGMRFASAIHFQHSFMKLLRGAQFEQLSARDLMLTYALNTDYLVTLPIFIDWNKAAEANVIIFRRGYATERQKGLLLAEKLDYLQSKLLQKIFFSFSEPLKKLGHLVNEALKRSTGAQDLEIWLGKLKFWLKDQYYPENLPSSKNNTSRKSRSDHMADTELPIWIAAQEAISRYEGLLAPVGPRGRLLRRLLTWTGLIPALPEVSVNFDVDTKCTESYLRPNFLKRITLANIWQPASREYCGNNVWEIFKVSIGILFAQSTLQEPAFKELILLYSDKLTISKKRVKSDLLPLQLQIYENISIPDLPVVFPHKKLSFRILDTVRLDVATVIGLLAYFVNYKFENIASSPSAVVLDVVAFSSLVILVFRVVLGYKQTWDRYQLLVNKTLYQKTVASGFGSLHFLVDASEQQQFKEALLVYALLLKPEEFQVSSRRRIKNACEQFLHEKFKEKIEMPIDKAMETLLRLNLVVELPIESGKMVVPLSCSEGCELLRKRWGDLLEQQS